MPYLKIIKASAGSGKTFRLALEYLKLLMQYELIYFRHILAVTFTNKATEEMKLRILDELYRLAYNQQSEYLSRLCNETGFTEEKIRNKSKAILNHILHNYSRFKVETIDKFFLSVFLEFTRELGLPGGHEIEIDQLFVLDEAIEKLYRDIDQDKQLRQWLLDYLEIKLLDGRSSDISKELQNLGQEIFKESFKHQSSILQDKISDKDFLKDYYRLLFTRKTSFEQSLKDIAAEAIHTMNKNNLGIDDFYQKGRGPAGYFRKLYEGQIEKANNFTLEALSSPDKWSAKTSANKEKIEELAVVELIPALERIQDIFHDEYKNYCTANAILKNIHVLGIITDIQRNVQSVLRSSNRFVLADISPFINKIISHHDAPFIFEKFGNRFHHFMIDEFQDTSEVQWENFRPLIQNSIADGNENILVGDIKQSIYRWRNSNWEILAYKLEEEFDNRFLSYQTLHKNWRSSKRIIEFNNALFKKLPGSIQNRLTNDLGATAEDFEFPEMLNIENFYSDCTQELVEQTKNSGYVRFDFFTHAEISQESALNSMLQHIDLLIEKGFRAEDIAVLVREKKEGEQIMRFLLSELPATVHAKHIRVISDETLYLRNSSLISLIVALMRYVMNPSDTLIKTFVCSEYENYIQNHQRENVISQINTSGDHSLILLSRLEEELHRIRRMPLYEAVEFMVRVLDLKTNEKEHPYLVAFLDLIFDYSKKNITTIQGFLHYWELKGAETTISLPEGQDAIRIITIHKSKGLEFRAVIMPYCDWSLEPHTGSVLWSSAKNNPFNLMPLIPVNYSSRLADTEFADDYIRERIKAYIDNLNLLYVAFTRAKEVLLASALIPKRKSTASFYEILYDTLPGISVDLKESVNDGEQQTFEYGELPEESRQIESYEPLSVPFNSYDTLNSLKIAGISPGMKEDDEWHIPTGLDRGKIMHMIMEKIITVDDIKNAVDYALMEGMIEETQEKSLVEYFTSRITGENVRKWFDGSCKVFTERDFVIPGGSIKRPDRIVICNNEVVVVDYKFGKHKTAAYKQQMLEYIDLLKETKYKVNRGIIWYVDLDEFETID